jgi:hypothetical protein
MPERVTYGTRSGYIEKRVPTYLIKICKFHMKDCDIALYSIK